MSRVIKFRAWDKSDEIMRMPLTFDNIVSAAREFESTDRESSLPRSDYMSFSHNNTIWMQFIGLTDKNGKEIYESDLALIEGYIDGFYPVQPIMYSEEHTAFGITDSRGGFKDIGGLVADKSLTIIGNQYENPLSTK